MRHPGRPRGAGIVNAVPRFVADVGDRISQRHQMDMRSTAAGDIVLSSRSMPIDRKNPDLHAVADAYREARMERLEHNDSIERAAITYRERHPDASRDEVATEVPRLIRDAAEVYGKWLYGAE